MKALIWARELRHSDFFLLAMWPRSVHIWESDFFFNIWESDFFFNIWESDFFFLAMRPVSRHILMTNNMRFATSTAERLRY
jgi:hypothetical protein